jgi:hypothetical protein
MSVENNLMVEFSQEELAKLSDALEMITEVFQGKTVGLTPEQRRQLASVAERNKGFVDKCKAYMDQEPSSIPPTINKEEFDKDYIARTCVEPVLSKLTAILQDLKDTKTFLDNYNYAASIAYYNYIKYLASQKVPGGEAIYADLKKHFGPASKKVKDTPQSPE